MRNWGVVVEDMVFFIMACALQMRLRTWVYGRGYKASSKRRPTGVRLRAPVLRYTSGSLTHLGYISMLEGLIMGIGLGSIPFNSDQNPSGLADPKGLTRRVVALFWVEGMG